MTRCFKPGVVHPAARSVVQFGDSDAEVVIDDITLTPTDSSPSFAGDLAGAEPPPTNPTTWTTTPTAL